MRAVGTRRLIGIHSAVMFAIGLFAAAHRRFVLQIKNKRFFSGLFSLPPFPVNIMVREGEQKFIEKSI
jgi:hypothetical protein